LTDKHYPPNDPRIAQPPNIGLAGKLGIVESGSARKLLKKMDTTPLQIPGGKAVTVDLGSGISGTWYTGKESGDMPRLIWQQGGWTYRLLDDSMHFAGQNPAKEEDVP